jgi:hypothetical protein
VIEAIELLSRYVGQERTRYYNPAESVPIEEGVVPAEWRGAVVDQQGKVERISYELCALIALLCNEIPRRGFWIAGASRWRNPGEDLPRDFEDTEELGLASLTECHPPADPNNYLDAEWLQRLRIGRLAGIEIRHVEIDVVAMIIALLC